MAMHVGHVADTSRCARRIRPAVVYAAIASLLNAFRASAAIAVGLDVIEMDSHVSIMESLFPF
jgi:hypothetical protein